MTGRQWLANRVDDLIWLGCLALALWPLVVAAWVGGAW